MAGFYNNTSDTIITGTANVDSIENHGTSVVIKAGAGNDAINNTGRFVIIYGENGNDSIQNSGDYAMLFGGAGNNTLRNSGNNTVLIGGDGGTNVIISSSGESTLVGGNGSNTLTGSGGANVFVHQNGANDLITNYDQLEDVIILASGYVSESLTSGKDAILKISDGDNNLGSITVKGGANQYLTVHDEEYANKCKEAFLEFSNAYIKAVVKTFEEDEDTQSILTDGENSAALAEIKAVNPGLAAQIATAVKRSYEACNAYLTSGIIPKAKANTGSNGLLANSAASNDAKAIESFNSIMSSLDYEATVFEHINRESALITGVGKGMAKASRPLSVGVAATSYAAYSCMLYNENLVPAWQNYGNSGATNLQEKIASIRSQNSAIFDGWVKSNVDLIFTIGGALALGAMAGASVVGAPVIAVATLCFVAPIAINGFYDNFVAPKLDAEADKLQARMRDKFNDEYGDSANKPITPLSKSIRLIDLWDNNTVSTYLYYPYEGYSTSRTQYILNGNVLSGTPGDDSTGIFTEISSVNRIVTGAGNDEVRNVGALNIIDIDVGSGNNTVNGENKAITITAGNGDNSIYGSAATVITGNGDNTIYGEYVKTGNGNNTIYGEYVKTGNGNNYISSDGTIKTGSGNDYIKAGDNSSTNAGEGNNTVVGGGTIKTGFGNDYIEAWGSIDAGEGKNTVVGGGTIKTGSVNDYIEAGDNSSIDAGEGKNTIIGGWDNTIKSGSGNDSIYAWGSIDAGEGKNTVVGSGTIKTGFGNDYIEAWGSIDAGEGKNTVVGGGTIKTGSGDDFVSVNGEGIVEAGNGNNTVLGGETIKTGSGDDFVSVYGASIEAGDGNNTVIGGGIIKTGSGDDYIEAWDSIDAGDGNNTVIGGSTIKTGSGNDYIYDCFSIDAGDGNNTVISGYGTIKTGSGDDYIYDCSSIDAGDGNNTILSDWIGTLKTGSGNDYVSVGSITNTLTTGDGDDTIIMAGSFNAVVVSGGNNYISITGVEYEYGYDSLTTGDGDDTIIIFYDSWGYNLVNAGNGSNNITVSGGHNTITAGTGNDTIAFYNGDNIISAGAGNDRINLSHSGNNSIAHNTGDGNDTIFGINSSDMLELFGRKYSTTVSGSDIIVSVGGNSITLKDAKDTTFQINGEYDPSPQFTILYNQDSNITVKGKSGDDNIMNEGSQVKIDSGAGNDTIENSGRGVSINGGIDNDLITNIGDSVTIDSGSGNDTIRQWGVNTKVSINSGAGDDYIHSNAFNSTIDTGDGNDFIGNWGESADNVKINSGNGTDTIDNAGDSVTIDAGDGNDLIKGNGGSNVQIIGGAGKDTIYNWKESNYVTIDAGSDNDVVYNHGGSRVKINGGDGSDTVYNREGYYWNEETRMAEYTVPNNVTIDASNGDDYIWNYGNNVSINSGSGNNYIYNGIWTESTTWGENVTIVAGNGKDTVTNYGTKTRIDTGAGNDSIQNYGTKATITGGNGNDTIYNNSTGMVYVYRSGDGNDNIFGYNDDDTIYISTGSISSASISSEDVVLKIGNGTVNLKAAKAKPLKLKNSSGAVIETIIGGSSEETLPPDTDTLPAGISISGATLTASTAFTGNSISLADVDSAVTKVNASALSRGISIIGTAADNSLKGGKGADTISGGAGNDTVSLGSGADVYVYESGNDLIQDYAAADKIKLAIASITSSSLSGSNVVLKTSAGNITVKGGKDKSITVINASGNETTKIYPEASSDSLPAGISVSGSTLTASTVFTGNKIDLADYATSVTKVNASALTRGVTIVGSSAANSIKGGKGADTISGGTGNDTVSLGGGADVYVYNSGNDLIQDYAAADKIKLASATITGSSLSGSNVVLKTSAGNITLKSGKGKNVTVIDANGNKTTKTYPESSLPVGISVSGAVLTAATTFTGNKIDLADYSSTVTKVNASNLSRGVTIVGSSAANSIKGGKSADTISGGAGNDTVSLGSGADVYIYSSGNDLIQDYAAGTDKIKLVSASITGASLSGKNVVLKTSAGNLTVKNGKDKAITVVDASGNETSKVYPETSSDTLPSGLSYDSAKKVLTVGTSYGGAAIDLKDFATTTKTVDASKFTKAIKITGTNRAESLVGGSKADTLTGGKGNDTLKGNGGNDIFVYSTGDGADVIADFTAGDKISLASGSVSSAALKNSDMILKIGSGSITVKNGKGKEISVSGAIYYDNLIYDSKKTAVTLGSGFSGTLGASDYNSKTKTINANAVTQAVNIMGNSVANSIFGGSKADSISGGAGNDSLVGGAGDDTLTGGDDKDVFVYGSGDGYDIITDYTAGQDKIKLTSGTISGTSYSGSNVIFSVGDGSITVKDGNGKKITIVDAAGKTSTKTYSGAVANARQLSFAGNSAMWFMEGDDNFTTGVEELSATFKDSCSESAPGDLSVRSEDVDLTAEIATAAPLFRSPEKN